MEQGVLSFGGSWTQEKLEILRKYLEAYTTVMKRQAFETLYIDAFAGTGYCGKREEHDEQQLSIFEDLAEEDSQAYIKGSARIALEVEPSFSHYIYVDLDPRNCARLEELKTEYHDKADRIEVIHGDANEQIQRLIKTMSWHNKRRAVMFLDPFAMQVRWETIRSVAKSGAIDLWYLFPISAVNRMLPRSGKMQEGWAERLNDLFGADDWRECFYKVKQESDLFGDSDRIEKTANWEGIANYIVRRLKDEFPYVAEKPRYLVNRRSNTKLFLMCFAAAEPTKGGALALKIAQHILRSK
ncbi:MAG: three-Cys-motif partner protein TcmP [Armatimonadota bacterium]